MKHLPTLILVLLILGGCSPSEEELKREATELYEEVRAIPADLPCRNKAGYEDLKILENTNNTNFFTDITNNKLEEYEEKCRLLLEEAERERLIRLEQNKLGDWSVGSYVDEFGDETSERYLRIETKGFFSNSATTDSPLKVRMFLNDGSTDNPWFRLYEYAGNNPIKGTYTNSWKNSLWCKARNSLGNEDEFNLNQYKGADSFSLDENKNGLKIKKFLSDNINQETSIKFYCYLKDRPSTTYSFELNNKYFKNALRRLNG